MKGVVSCSTAAVDAAGVEQMPSREAAVDLSPPHADVLQQTFIPTIHHIPHAMLHAAQMDMWFEGS